MSAGPTTVVFENIPFVAPKGEEELPQILLRLKKIVERATGLFEAQMKRSEPVKMVHEGLICNKVYYTFQGSAEVDRLLALLSNFLWGMIPGGALKEVTVAAVVEDGKSGWVKVVPESPKEEIPALGIKFHPDFRPSLSSIYETLIPDGPILSLLASSPAPPRTGEVFITFASPLSLFLLASLSRAEILALAPPNTIQIVPSAGAWPAHRTFVAILKELGVERYDQLVEQAPAPARMGKDGKPIEAREGRFSVEPAGRGMVEMVLRKAEAMGYTSQGVKFEIRQPSIWGPHEPTRYPFSIPRSIQPDFYEFMDANEQGNGDAWIYEGQGDFADLENRSSGDEDEGMESESVSKGEAEAEAEEGEAGEAGPSFGTGIKKGRGKGKGKGNNKNKNKNKKENKKAKAKEAGKGGRVSKDGSKWVGNGQWGKVKFGALTEAQKKKREEEMKANKKMIDAWAAGVGE